MPNWVKNCVSAPRHVLEAMLSDDKTRVDFNKVVTIEFPNDWDGIYGSSESLAREKLGIALQVEQTPLEDRVAKLNHEGQQQYQGMLDNYEATGFLHTMEFAREVWGTKWNACYSDVSTINQGYLMFETAWSCPEGMFNHLSAKFPNDEIKVEFADEDLGHNCGTIAFMDGGISRKDVAPSVKECSLRSHRTEWYKFACKMHGYDYEQWLKDIEEND